MINLLSGHSEIETPLIGFQIAASLFLIAPKLTVFSVKKRPTKHRLDDGFGCYSRRCFRTSSSSSSSDNARNKGKQGRSKHREMVKCVPEVVLSNGCKMPLVGMGLATYQTEESETVKSAVLKAIELCYRHFDTALLYQMKKQLGLAIAEALKLGLIKSHDDLFITSKLWCSDGHPHLVIPAHQTTLKNLGLDYLDLYLIHWPVSTNKQGKYDFIVAKEELVQMDYKSVWAAMEEVHRLGFTKSISVSNFSCKKLEYLLSKAKIAPTVNQVEINPLWRQDKLKKFYKDKGIVITGYSILGANGVIWGTNRVMESQVLKEVGISKGKSVAQVCLRYLYEQGVTSLVKSFNEGRIKENPDIFKWELSEEDSKKFGEIRQSRGSPGDSFVSDNGPFKSKEELWDGEL
ncbi:hypothetical protein Scep_021556 [Stephania cephalantha]|uniref:codeinone reductase (NADPH) n=1 Tax=Stephania cephalantha TaxID=152367 RepID=A0AAP0I0B5_9MAGN